MSELVPAITVTNILIKLGTALQKEKHYALIVLQRGISTMNAQAKNLGASTVVVNTAHLQLAAK